jgi:hypothetical protein
MKFRGHVGPHIPPGTCWRQILATWPGRPQRTIRGSCMKLAQRTVTASIIPEWEAECRRKYNQTLHHCKEATREISVCTFQSFFSGTIRIPSEVSVWMPFPLSRYHNIGQVNWLLSGNIYYNRSALALQLR